MTSKGLSYVGEFLIEEATIITSENLVLDIASNIGNINIFEDIENSAIMGEMVFSDPIGVDTVGPIIGQEYLSLVIKTPTVDEQENIFDFREHTAGLLSIYHYDRKIEIGVKGSGHIVRFMTSEFIKNNRLKLSQTFTGSYSDIVKKVLKEIIQTPKDCYIEPTLGNKKILVPDISPFEVIEMAKRESISVYASSPTYFFYETKRGYHFRSIDSMAAEGTVQDYTTFPSGSKYSGRGAERHQGLVEQTTREYMKIITYNIDNANDMVLHQHAGTFSSKTITHDIYNKRYDISLYNYHDNFEKESHMNKWNLQEEHPNYSSTPVDNKRNRISDFPTKTYYMPVSHKYPKKKIDGSYLSKSGKSIYHSTRPMDWMGRRTSQMMQLKAGREIVLTVNGQTGVSAGDMVNIEIPFRAAANADRRLDRFFDGPFLVKRIRHNFDSISTAKPMHNMFLNCIKDCVNESLKESEDAYEPTYSKKGVVVTDFYGETAEEDVEA